MINIEYDEYFNSLFLVKPNLSSFTIIRDENYTQENYEYQIYDDFSSLKQVTIAPSILGFW